MKQTIIALLILLSTSACSQVYVPNTITPNGDGHNDYFAVTTADTLVKFDLRIYSLWGELVFHTTDPNNVWLGGQQYYNADGVYVFLISWRRRDEFDDHVEKGHVLILR